MFKTANSEYEAKASSAAPKSKTLAKQLFPSSSPSASQNGSLDEHFKKPTRPGSSFFASHSSRQPNRPEPPLKQQSPNITRPAATTVPQTTLAKSGQAFASLYSKSGSFQDTEDFTDDNKALSSGASSRLIAGVLINDDDFDDDEDLEIDNIPIAGLPSLPPPPRPAVSRNEPPPATDTSNLSWSQSSPSHLGLNQPSRPQPNTSAKRQSPEQDSSPLPAAKKRNLPKDWQKKVEMEDDEGILFGTHSTATPAPLSRSSSGALYNASASAVKAQKKQFRNGLIKPGNPPADVGATAATKKANKSHGKAQAISLSREQQHVRELVVDRGQSVFFTGPAGTGKSVLMRAIIQDLKRKHAKDPERVAVTASTGLAACNIGGMTLHSFSGIGLGKEDVQTLVKKIRRNPKAKNRWLKTSTLVMDEVSMVDGELFDKLSQIGRTIRNNGRPWGGIQLVITGDFFQLPPVPDSKVKEAKFAFEAATWNTSIDHTIGLTEVFRQRDPVFAQMLNEMRLGRISDETVHNFRGLSRNLEFDDGLEVTELFPTRNEVDASNDRRLRALPGKSYRYEAFDSGMAEPAMREKLLQNMMAPKTLELKKGAQVMLIKNLDETLVNGSLGTVIRFMTQTLFEISGPDEGYASDGEGDAKSKKRMRALANALSMEKSSSGGDRTEYPLVRFHAVDGTERVLLMVPEDWKVELPNGDVQAERKQLPLILAWALSIHKAQGQTLERVKVDLGKIFEKGQAYVALSRATTQEGLQVLRFQKDKVMAHPRVVGFYNKLYSAESAAKKKPASSISNFVYKEPAKYSAAAGADEDETGWGAGAAQAAYG